MGKWVGYIHQHDMPPITHLVDNGAVWECSCGELFHVHKMQNIWLPVDKKNDVVTRTDTEE